MQIDENVNIGIERIRTKFHEILNPYESAEIEPFSLSLFDIDILKEGYVSYLGSLTTPPCSESVIWLIPLRIKSITIDEVTNFSLNIVSRILLIK